MRLNVLARKSTVGLFANDILDRPIRTIDATRRNVYSLAKHYPHLCSKEMKGENGSLFVGRSYDESGTVNRGKQVELLKLL